MKIEKYPLNDVGELVKIEVDCLWVRLTGRSEPSPLKSHALQYLDWELQGTLTREIQGNGPRLVTFVPTQHRISAPLIAIESERSANWDAFFSNCAGQRWGRVLYFFEDPKELTTVERALKKFSNQNHPELILVATDKT